MTLCHPLFVQVCPATLLQLEAFKGSNDVQGFLRTFSPTGLGRVECKNSACDERESDSVRTVVPLTGFWSIHSAYCLSLLIHYHRSLSSWTQNYRIKIRRKFMSHWYTPYKYMYICTLRSFFSASGQITHGKSFRKLYFPITLITFPLPLTRK